MLIGLPPMKDYPFLLTHCKLNEHPPTPPPPTLYIGRFYFRFEACQAMWFRYSQRKMVEQFANSGDPDPTSRSAASDLCLHCLPFTLLGVLDLG